MRNDNNTLRKKGLGKLAMEAGYSQVLQNAFDLNAVRYNTNIRHIPLCLVHVSKYIECAIT